MSAAVQQEWAWSPQLGPQTNAIVARKVVQELFFGGARGGGKSSYLLGDWLQDIDQGQNWRGILFRRSYPELDEIIRQSLQIFPLTGGEWKVGAKEWRWPNGAQLSLRHLDNDADIINYQGHSYSWVAWDELPTWPSMDAYRQMLATLRGPAQNKRVRATGNPGGRCHNEVKRYFGIDKCPAGNVPFKDKRTGHVRLFVPSKVEDNQILLDNDPGYIQRLQGVGDPELVRAWLAGDWDSSPGSMFGVSRDQVLVEPFEIPSSWPLFVSLDYGEQNPSVGCLIAVDYDDDIWVINSYYASGAGAEHARGIKAMIEGCPFTRGRNDVVGRAPRMVLAPSDMWTKRSPGEAATARSVADTFQEQGIHLTRANMDRVGGWRAIANLLHNGRLKFFDGYTNRVVDSLLSVQRDSRNPEDVEKGGDDHGADCFVGSTLVDTSEGPKRFDSLVGTVGQVRSYDGKLHPYTHVERYGEGVETVRLVFSDGRTVQCTPDHQFLSADGQWIPAVDLERVELWKVPKLSRQRAKNTKAAAITFVDSIFSAMASVCTVVCSKIAMGLSLPVCTSITGTAMRTTMPQAILSLSTQERTPNCTLNEATLKAMDSPPKLIERQQNGIRVKVGGHGIVGMESEYGSNKADKKWQRFVQFAKARTRRTGSWLIALSSAMRIAEPVRCVRVEPAGKSDVYCLTVPSLSAFTIEGGIAVHNCLRYGVNHVYKARRREEQEKADGAKLIQQLLRTEIKTRYS